MLGAAVADDVMGLVVLTVVVRLVTEGSVSVAVGARHHRRRRRCSSSSAASSACGSPRRCSRSSNASPGRRGRSSPSPSRSRSAFAELADAAKLAPIVGAFVAGIALGRSRSVRPHPARARARRPPVHPGVLPPDRHRRRHRRLRRAASVLRDAGDPAGRAPSSASWSRRSAPSARRATSCSSGSGMLPRGEVGLIFATIGLQNGVLGDDLYAALLLVVLVTTLVTPPAAQAPLRPAARRRRARSARPRDTPPPEGGWLQVGERRGRAGGRPPDDAGPAARPRRRRPRWPAADRRTSCSTGSPTVPDAAAPGRPSSRQASSTSSSGATPGRGGSSRPPACSTRALPELATRLPPASRRQRSPSTARERTGLPSMRAAPPARRRRPARRSRCAPLEHVDRLLLAAFLVEALEDEPDLERARADAAPAPARPRAEPTWTSCSTSSRDRDLLWSAAHQPGALSEERVLAARRPPGHPRAGPGRCTCSAPSAARAASAGSCSGCARCTSSSRRRLADDDARRGRGPLAGRAPQGRGRRPDPRVSPARSERLERAPARLRAAHAVRRPSPATPACSTRRRPRTPRVAVTPADEVGWWVDVAWHDDAGRLAAITNVLADHRARRRRCRPRHVARRRGARLVPRPARSRPTPRRWRARIAGGVRPADDDAGHPRRRGDRRLDVVAVAHGVRGPCTDRPGLLHALATAFAAAQVEVRAAQVTAHDGLVIDRFEVTDQDGAKLSDDDVERFTEMVRAGVTARRRRFSRRLLVRAGSSP